MTDTALYYALSTIAQVAGTLAALIGFLGLWRLDRLREEDTQLERSLQGFVIQTTSTPPAVLTRERIRELCQQIITAPQPGPQTEEYKLQIEPRFRRWQALPGLQRRLMRVLHRFLMVTLAILVVATVLLVFADALSAWVWPSRLLIIALSLILGVGPFSMVREAARATRTLCLLALLFGLASPALAWAASAIPGTPASCTTTYDSLLARWETVCDDGTRAVTRHNTLLDRDETTIMSGPRRACTGQRNAITQQVEVRCR